MRAGSSHGGQVLKSKACSLLHFFIKIPPVSCGCRGSVMLGVTDLKYNVFKSVQKLQLFITCELVITPLTAAVGQP